MAAAGFKGDIIRTGGDDAHPLEVRALRQYCLVNAALVDEHQFCIPEAGRDVGVVGAHIAGAVSYTHLDVYKRQGSARPLPPKDASCVPPFP